ncbi:MAG: hypothetical protein U9R20_02230 [Thermodesulfobacteriota bacterium]|nr:hypothetical protein [Thermodesulfobacteriota bacterium]
MEIEKGDATLLFRFDGKNWIPAFAGMTRAMFPRIAIPDPFLYFK